MKIADIFKTAGSIMIGVSLFLEASGWKVVDDDESPHGVSLQSTTHPKARIMNDYLLKTGLAVLFIGLAIAV